MIKKQMPTTTRNMDKVKDFFSFMKGKGKSKKVKCNEEEVKKNTIFAEIMEKPAPVPKTSRNVGRKSFLFLEEDSKKKI